MSTKPSKRFVGRGGEKLDAALDAFGIDVRERTCADFGCNVGGFTDCLLQRGAEKVYAVDTGYGALAWTLRRDERVVVMERTNALYCDVPESVDLVVLDTARTPLKLIVPAGLRWLRPDGAMVALLKPHYELAKMDGRTPRQTLDEPEARQVCLQVCQGLAEVGAAVRALLPSPLLGKGGNREFLLLIAAQGSD